MLNHRKKKEKKKKPPNIILFCPKGIFFFKIRQNFPNRKLLKYFLTKFFFVTFFSVKKKNMILFTDFAVSPYGYHLYANHLGR